MPRRKKPLEKVEKDLQKGLVEVGKKFKETLANVASHLPLANLSHNKKTDKFTIEVDLPGVKKEDINLSVEGDYLVVTAEKKMKKEVNKEDYYLMESLYGKYARSFYLPEDIDRDSIEAKYENGRLTITFEKVASKKRRDIAIS
jgi:HSP20 family protein